MPSMITLESLGSGSYAIHKNGERIGRIIGSGSERWILLLTKEDQLRGQAVARFRYCNPALRCKTWVREVCARFDNEKIVELTQTMTPVEIEQLARRMYL